MPLEEVQFFGTADRQGNREDGKIASEYPSWYFDQHIDELRVDIEHKTKQLDMDTIPASEVPYAREELKRQNEMLARIESKPELKGKDKEEAGKLYNHLSGEIADSMFSRSEMKKGLVDAHEEVRRMTEPIINVKGSTKALAQMGITARNGKISRNQAAKAFKLTGRLLGEPTNIEYLRKDFKHGTFHPERSLEEMER